MVKDELGELTLPCQLPTLLYSILVSHLSMFWELICPLALRLGLTPQGKKPNSSASFSACVHSSYFCLLASQPLFLSPFVLCVFLAILFPYGYFLLTTEVYFSNKRFYGVSFKRHQMAKQRPSKKIWKNTTF